MHKALHPRDDVARLYIPKKKKKKREEEDLLASKTALTHPYNDSKTT